MADVVASVDQVVFLPLIGGAIGATAALGEGHFAIAARDLLEGGGATMFIAATASITQRIVAWGDRTPKHNGPD